MLGTACATEHIVCQPPIVGIKRCSRLVQEGLAGQIVFQVDQAAPAYQALSGHQRKCGGDATLTRCAHLCADRHSRKGSSPCFTNTRSPGVGPPGKKSESDGLLISYPRRARCAHTASIALSPAVFTQSFDSAHLRVTWRLRWQRLRPISCFPATIPPSS